jgi:hypothetical protein
MSLGLMPEVEEPTIASAAAWASISASTACLSSSRSGTLSWISVAPSTASEMLAA